MPQLRYLDAGDTLTLTCGTKSAEFAVVDVDREKDLTEDELLDLECEMDDFDNPEVRKRAEEKFNNTKVVMIVKLKPTTK